MIKFTNTSFKVLMALVTVSFIITSCGQSNNKNKDLPPKVAKLNLPEDFHAEHLYSPSEHDKGTWIAMTFDDKGRLITSDQHGSLYRVTIPPIGYDTTKTSVKVKPLPVDLSKDSTQIGYAHGLLHAFNSLYVMVNGDEDPETEAKHTGLYRLQDTNNDDVYDKLTLLKKLDGRGEHGPHSIVLGPKKKAIYVVAGNFTKMPKMDAYRLPPTWQVDNLLPLLYDPRGFGAEIEPPAPGGWIAKVSPDGSKWTLISSGYRNPYDMAFNHNGDLFTFDSDMEWDLGLPWYRPTRISLVASGSEFGYREHNQKWDPTYPDNLPPILAIGQGSPTNIMAAHNARFPTKYRKGLYMFDWSYGIIYHIILTPHGSSYKAKAKEFITGAPLPLVDGAIGPDGAMYFVTGGRELDSDLYRVYYGKGNLKKEPLKFNGNKKAVQARKLRHKLEQYHVNSDSDPSAIEFSWPYLKSSDRFIRYAARIAIEHQPVDQWKQKALNEKDPIIRIHALLALARSADGSENLQTKMLNQLITINYKQLSNSQKIDLVRTIEVTLARMGNPDGEIRNKLIAYLAPKFPVKTGKILNRLLSKVLVYIDAPEATEKVVHLLYKPIPEQDSQNYATKSAELIRRNFKYGSAIAKMLNNMPPGQHIYYAVVLSGATEGWTQKLRNKYFEWFYKALSEFKGGNSYIGYINEARNAALEHVAEDMYAHYNTISGDSLLNESGNALVSKVPQPKGPGKNWTVESALDVVQSGMDSLDYEYGKNMFIALTCGRCHRVGNIGTGGIGPALTQLGTRFSYKDMLQAIIHPSKAISSQYASTVFHLKDGSTVMGSLQRKDESTYYISLNPYNSQDIREVPKDKVVKTEVADVSIMPPSLINRLNPSELKDLLAFLKSGGNKDAEIYKSDK